MVEQIPVKHVSSTPETGCVGQSNRPASISGTIESNKIQPAVTTTEPLFNISEFLYLRGITGALTCFTKIPQIQKLQDLKPIPHAVIASPYNSINNFTHRRLYHSSKLFAHKEAVAALDKVALNLKQQGYGVIVWDAYRPIHVQARMFEILPDERYCSKPTVDKARHCRGTAIDLTLYKLNDPTQKPLNMGSEFDECSDKSHSNSYDTGQVHGDKPEAEAVSKNRAILSEAMKKYGFAQLPTEWWHYDFGAWNSKDGSDNYNYPVMDVPLTMIPALKMLPKFV